MQTCTKERYTIPACEHAAPHISPHLFQVSMTAEDVPLTVPVNSDSLHHPLSPLSMQA